MAKLSLFIPEGIEGKLTDALFKRDCYSLNFITKCYILISRLYIEQFRSGKKQGQYDVLRHGVQLHSKLMQSYLGTRDSGRVKTILRELSIIEYNEKDFIANKKSITYRLKEQFWNSKFCVVEKYDKRVVATLCKSNQKLIHQICSREERQGYKKIYASLDQLSFDSDAAENYVILHKEKYEKDYHESETDGKLTKRNGFHHRIWVIDGIKNKSLLRKDDLMGRCYHELTYLTKDLRQFLSFRGTPLYQCDVRSCQISLLASLYSEKTEEYYKFVTLLEEGRFMEWLNIESGGVFNDADGNFLKGDLKYAFFKYIEFGSPNYIRYEKDKVKAASYKALVNAMRRNFPQMMNIIEEAKKPNSDVSKVVLKYNPEVKFKDGKKRKALAFLPLLMQREEVSIILEGVAAEFASKFPEENIILVSVHDCLVTTQEYIEEVANLMKMFFLKKMGFNASLKIERF